MTDKGCGGIRWCNIQGACGVSGSVEASAPTAEQGWQSMMPSGVIFASIAEITIMYVCVDGFYARVYLVVSDAGCVY